MSNEADCRTARVTPGLLISYQHAIVHNTHLTLHNGLHCTTVNNTHHTSHNGSEHTRITPPKPHNAFHHISQPAPCPLGTAHQSHNANMRRSNLSHLHCTALQHTCTMLLSTTLALHCCTVHHATPIEPTAFRCTIKQYNTLHYTS